MRVIKFRAWDCDIYDPIGKYYGEMKYFELGDSIPPTCSPIMQYTGLKDKKGREIYEGDVVSYDGEIFEIKFGALPLNKSGDCVCTYESFYAQPLSRNSMYECYPIEDYQIVVGNVYENPELIKEDK